MTESEWSIGSNIYFMIESLAAQDGTSRRLRLFACACCRRVWEVLSPVAKSIVELSEDKADSVGPTGELRQLDASFDVDLIGHEFREHKSVLVIKANQAARSMVSPAFAVDIVVQDTSCDPTTDFIPGSEEDGPGRGVLTLESEVNNKLQLLRDIFGNPFKPVACKPAWRTPTVLAFATQMYESRDFSLMPILADALQDAGCDSEEIISHCMGQGPHVRGCWVVDLILGKERPVQIR